jgi:hypothetical protein
MTTTADTLTDSRSIEDIGRCVACGSTAGGLWGCCFVCGCPTPERQRSYHQHAPTLGAKKKDTVMVNA